MERLPSGPQAALIGFSIRFRGTVIALACLLVVYGVYSLSAARYDVFPEFVPPQVSIQTEAAGLTAEQVEALVTRPIENAISGIPDLERMQSVSIQGLSAITLFVNPASDIYRDRQIAAERLAAAARQLPAGVQPPAMTPLTSSTNIVLVIGLSSTTRSLMALRTLADWTVRPRILAVRGVAATMIFGGAVRSLQIQVHPDQLIRYAIGLDDVLAAARRATGVRGAGFLHTPNQRIVLQADGQALTASALAQSVILRHGAGVVTLGDVARVASAAAPAAGAGAIDGRPGVVMNISEQYGANTLEVTKALETTLADLRQQLGRDGITLHTALFRPADFIDTALGNIRAALLLGGALVVVVLFLFLFDLRVAAISCVAIPLSLLAATIALERLGATLNTMTLGGLAIAIGEVVDDAVIGIENIVRRLRENRRLPRPRADALVAFAASLEVRSPVVYATFAVILVFLPLLALPGVSGRLFAPLGVAYILAVLASLAVALTVTPALAMVLLAGRPMQPRDPPVVRWSRRRYERLLERIAGRPRLVVAAAAVLAMLAGGTLPFLEGSFIPDLKEGHFVVHMTAAPGTSLAQSLELGARATEALSRLPEVLSVAQRVGRAVLSDDTTGTHYSEFEVNLRPLTGAAAVQARIDVARALSGLLGVNVSVFTPLSERIAETLSGYSAALAVSIIGNDLDRLDRKAREVARVLGQVRGATGVQVVSPPGMPEVTIRLRKPDLQRWGLDATDVLDLIHAAYAGETVGQVSTNGTVVDVIARLDAASRGSVSRLGDLPLRTRQGMVGGTAGGTFIQLRQVAEIAATTGRYQVAHLNGQRVQTVTANVSGRPVTAFARDAEAAIAAKVKLPVGTYLRFAGAAEAESQSRRAILLDALIAGVGIVVLLGIATGNWRNLLLVLVNLPFALVGGVLAVLATGGLLSLGSIVGFVTLFGITLRNSIMMICHYEHLVAIEGRPWGPATAISGAADRLVPILMTSLVTGLGLLPLAVGMNDPGREIEGPMAAVILGGLLTSMALNLLALPVLALQFGRFEVRRHALVPEPRSYR